MSRLIKIIVEKHSDGYVAYPVGLKGVVVGQGDSYEEALADAEESIRLHPGWFKGQYRRAQALLALGKYEDALHAYGGALRLEPGNDEIKQRINEVQGLIADAEVETNHTSASELKVVSNGHHNALPPNRSEDTTTPIVPIARQHAAPVNVVNLHLQKADEAFTVGEFTKAAELYTKTIEDESDTLCKLLIKRAATRQAMGAYEEVCYQRSASCQEQEN